MASKVFTSAVSPHVTAGDPRASPPPHIRWPGDATGGQATALTEAHINIERRSRHAPNTLFPQYGMDVIRRQDASQIGTDAEVRDLIADRVEAVRDTRRHDDDVAGRDAAALAVLEGPARTRADRQPDELGVGWEWSIVFDAAPGHERRAARDDVEDLGHLRVTDRPDGSARARWPTLQHADAEPVGAEIGDPDLPIGSPTFGAGVLQDAVDLGARDRDDRRRRSRLRNQPAGCEGDQEASDREPGVSRHVTGTPTSVSESG